jgi:hypothetical protein
MAWSATARWSDIKLPGCEHPGPCNNCERYARVWRADTVAALNALQQGVLELPFTAPVV